MSANQPGHDPDTDIREKLAAANRPPSQAHDANILKAARAFTNNSGRDALESGTGDDRRSNNIIRRHWPMAVAATLLLATGIALLPMPDSAPTPDIPRNQRSAIAPAANAVLTGAPEVFSWPKAAAGQSYRLEIRDAGGELVFQSPWQSASKLAVDTTLKQRLSVRGTYLWSVHNRGLAAANLGPFRLEISD